MSNGFRKIPGKLHISYLTLINCLQFCLKDFLSMTINLSYFSFEVDLQECNVTFESWGHTTKQLLFQWNADQLTVNPSVTEGLNQHSCQQEFINMTYGATTFSTGILIERGRYEEQ